MGTRTSARLSPFSPSARIRARCPPAERRDYHCREQASLSCNAGTIMTSDWPAADVSARGLRPQFDAYIPRGEPRYTRQQLRDNYKRTEAAPACERTLPTSFSLSRSHRPLVIKLRDAANIANLLLFFCAHIYVYIASERSAMTGIIGALIGAYNRARAGGIRSARIIHPL